MALKDGNCQDCRTATEALADGAQDELHREIPAWEIVNRHHLRREFRLSSFLAGVALINAIARLAEAEDHHPALSLNGRRVGVEIWTHRVNGLTPSDFVLAAKIDRLPEIQA